MAESHNAERIRALQGCAELYRIAASHLAAIPPNYEEASRAIATAGETGAQIQEAIILDYVMSGEFQKRAFANLQDKMDARIDNPEEFRALYEQTIPSYEEIEPCDPNLCCHNPQCPESGGCGGECARNF